MNDGEEIRMGLVDRFIAAEKLGRIKKWLYSYSPQDTLADTRYLFVDEGGTRSVTHGRVRDVLAEVEARPVAAQEETKSDG